MKHQTQSGVVLEGLQRLFALMKNDKAAREAAVEAGCMKMAAAVLKGWGQQAAVVEKALQVIGRSCLFVDHGKVAAGAAGCIESVVAGMVASS